MLTKHSHDTSSCSSRIIVKQLDKFDDDDDNDHHHHNHHHDEGTNKPPFGGIILVTKSLHVSLLATCSEIYNELSLSLNRSSPNYDLSWAD
jgi:hypothetical protein